jgi:hypothetical protein
VAWRRRPASQDVAVSRSVRGSNGVRHRPVPRRHGRLEVRSHKPGDVCDLLLADSPAETGVRRYAALPTTERRRSSLVRAFLLSRTLRCLERDRFSGDSDRALHPGMNRAEVVQGGSGGRRDLGADRLPGEEQEGVTGLV